MTTVYPNETGRCALCECGIHTTPHAGLHVIRGCAVIGYAFCLPCFDLTRHSLSAELVRRLEEKLDANAVTYGLEVRAEGA